MSTPELMTTCPSDETLAAFVDKRLDGPSRRRVIEHMAVCESCYAIVLAGMDFISAQQDSEVTRFHRRRATWLAIAAAAVVGFALLLTPIREQLSWNRSKVAALVRAARSIDHREIEGRLSGGFDYKPLKRIMRGSEDGQNLQLLAAAAQIEEDARANPSLENLHAYGVSRLLLKHYDNAVKIFTDALVAETGAEELPDAIAKSRNVPLLVDLAAAFQARGRHRNAGQDYVVALDAAERAWELEKTPEGAWNRAVTLESMAAAEDAILAWKDYLALDAESQWAQYARERILALRRAGRDNAWESTKERIRNAALNGNLTLVSLLVTQEPLQSRLWAEDVVLVQWAAAFAAGDVRTASEHLAIAASIGDALEQSTGESTLIDSVAAIRRAGAALAPAHLAYARGTELQQRPDMAAAFETWTATAGDFERHGSPLWIRAVVFASSAQYFMGDNATAITRLTRALENTALRERYRSAVAQAYWQRGLILSASGRQTEGTADFREALSLFEQLGEREHVLALHNRVATNLSYGGRDDEAWHHRIEAFRILSELHLRGEVRGSSRVYALLVDAARAAEDARYFRAALRFHDWLVRSTAGGDRVIATDALRARGVTRWKAGHADGAFEDVGAALTLAAAVPDRPMRERLLANLHSVESLLYREIDPDRSVRAASDAIAFYERVGNRLRLMDMYLDRALSHSKRQDIAAASRDLGSAITVLEEQRRDLQTSASREAFVERRRALFETGVGILVDHGDYDQAVSFGEAARARSMLDAKYEAGEASSAQPLPLVSLAQRMPDRTTLLWYAVLPHRLVIVAIGRDGVRGTVRQISAMQLSALTESVASACNSDDIRRCREDSAGLYDVMIRPIASSLNQRVVIVPDGVLHGVAVAALVDGVDDQYLIEEHEVAIAVSAATYVEGFNHREPSSLARAFIIGDPSFDRRLFPSLPALEGAQKEVQRIAETYTGSHLITGTAATREAFFRAARMGGLIHFAGHAVFDDDDPGRSALVLAPGRNGGDGRVFGADIVEHGMTGVQLVVLSACGSWKRVDAGGGPLGFAEVFLRAGAETVVASTSPIDDAAAPAVVIAFYEALQKEGDAARALREAQLRLLRSADPNLRAPRAWSSFVAIL